MDLWITEHSEGTKKPPKAENKKDLLDPLGIVRMETTDRLPQTLSAQVSVYLRSGYALVPQHLLHGTQIGTMLHQLGGKTVAQRMRTDTLSDTSGSNSFLQEYKHHLPAEVCTAAVQEQVVLLPRLRGNMTADIVDIKTEKLQRTPPHRNPPLFVALADHLYQLFVNVKVAQTQTHKFRHTKATVVQHLYDDIVAITLWST